MLLGQINHKLNPIFHAKISTGLYFCALGVSCQVSDFFPYPLFTSIRSQESGSSSERSDLELLPKPESISEVSSLVVRASILQEPLEREMRTRS